MNNLNNQVWDQITLEEAVVEVEKLNNEYEIRKLENEIPVFKNVIKEELSAIEKYENMFKNAKNKKRIKELISNAKNRIENYELLIDCNKFLIDSKKFLINMEG